MPGPVLAQLHLGAVEETGTSGSWEALLSSQVEERAPPSASSHHMGPSHSRSGAGVQDLRPCFPFHSGVLSLKGNAPLLSVVLVLPPFDAEGKK